MNAKAYRQATMNAEAKPADAKLQFRTDVRGVVKKTQSIFLTWLVKTAGEIEDICKQRTDGQKVPGLFEYVASGVATEFKLGSSAIRLIGFVGELSDDARQATIDVWAAQLLDAQTTGQDDLTYAQVSFLERGKLLRAAKNWIGKCKSFAILGTPQSVRAANYKDTLGPMLFASDIPQDEFRARLLMTGLSITDEQANGLGFDSALTYSTHLAVQFGACVSELNKTKRRVAATEGKAAASAIKADATVVESILLGDSPFTPTAEN